MNKNIKQIFKILRENYKPFNFDSREPFKVLVTTILSQRTRDEKTALASRQLFKIIKNPKDVLKIDPELIEKAIKPSGFYKVKTKRIIDISKQLVENHNCRVPTTIEELLKFKGVGRKTANAVLSFAFNKPAIVVDTHVRRISNRMGLVKTKTPEQTEMELRKVLPKEYWADINELLVLHGQTICRPIKPRCNECEIEKYCEKRTSDTRVSG
ncbi:MAG: endonuclease III domain-containing protein [Candidatus Aminicenantia bacterium]